ncbi:MAG: TlyA family rRNA (cytidine-2'-O)-methyltransferase, partial [Chthoniobacterales bacterium]|nr:TlyA family rRNA (cytidine-2'-O)-methyltransferase [Chthoniobacterales bacterium]
IILDGINARTVSPDLLQDKPALATLDLSFISLTYVIRPILELLAPEALLLVLIKPQFELEPQYVSRGGIVLNPSLHQKAIQKIHSYCDNLPGILWHGYIPSPILGAKGNQEFLALLQKITSH